MWVKVPSAAVSVVCSAGLVAALALPVTTQAGSELVKGAAVKLAVNLDRLAAFDAIPAYAQIAGGDVLAGLLRLASTDAIPVYAALLNGDASALGLLDSTSAIPSYTALLNGDASALGDLDSTSAIPSYTALLNGDASALGDLDSTSAVPAYAKALSGDSTDLFTLATLDGVPALAGAASGDLTALRGYDALSAIPEYLGLPEAAAAAPLSAQAAAPEKTQAAPSGSDVVKSFVTSVASALPGAGKQSALSVVPEAAQPDPANTPESAGDDSSKLTTKLADKSTQGNGDLGKFVPKIVGDSSIVFGSGGGSVDNGIRGWSKVVDKVKSALSGGSSSEGGGSGSGE